MQRWYPIFYMVECFTLAHGRHAVISTRSTFISKFVERFIYKVGTLHNRGCIWNCQVRFAVLHLWVGFIDLRLPNTVVFSCFILCHDIKLFQNERWGIFKILLKILFHIIHSICSFEFWSCKIMKVSIVVVYHRHKCDGRSGCPWSCRIMVKLMSWSTFS